MVVLFGLFFFSVAFPLRNFSADALGFSVSKLNRTLTLILSRMDHYVLSVKPLQHRTILFAVFCQAAPPRRV